MSMVGSDISEPIDNSDSEKEIVDLDESSNGLANKISYLEPELKPLDEKLIFYYDETNNIGKFWLNDTGVNTTDALTKDFVLGGIAFEEDAYPDVNELINKLNLQKASELKSSNLFRGKGFLDIMGSKRTNTFLNWLNDSPLFIHYASLNNVYFALVDIIDSLFLAYPEDFFIDWVNEKDAIDWMLDVKDSFYRHTKEHLPETVKLFIKHNYPEIITDDVPSFCYDWIEQLNVNKNSELELRFIVQFLKRAKIDKELPLLKGNIPGILVRDYATSYLERIRIFKKSYHIFDRELSIEQKLSTVKIIENGEVCTRYRFEDSKNDRNIQVSDVFVGLMGKYFSFLNEMDERQMNETIRNLSPQQKENFKLLNAIVAKSDDKSRTLISSFNPPSEAFKRGIILEWISRR
jgi:hypothetical protein